MQRNIRLVLEYDGTEFKGWQIQPGQRTVQAELESCLAKIFCDRIRVVAAGRTDSGVHALGQVVNFRANGSISVDRVPNALNGMLSSDFAVRRADEVPLTFHARRDAVRRRYFYRIGYGRRAVGRAYAWWLRSRLDCEAIEDGLSRLLGRHDFSSFCVAVSQCSNPDCHLYESRVEETESEICFRFEANRFLRSMIRGIVGTLVQVGRGDRCSQDITKILEARDRRFAGPSAPPTGLFLDRVIYNDTLGG